MPASDSKLFLTGCMGGFWIYACTSGENVDSGCGYNPLSVQNATLTISAKRLSVKMQRIAHFD